MTICECGHFKYNHEIEGCVLCDCGDPCDDTPRTWDEALELTVQQFKKIMRQRHLKYGPGNINAFGEKGCVIRLSDKLERLKNWYFVGGSEEQFDDESLEDTWIDAGNYAIIRMMYTNGWWNLPVEKEEEKENVYTEVLADHFVGCTDITCVGCDETMYYCNGKCGNGKEKVIWDAAHPLKLKKDKANHVSND